VVDCCLVVQWLWLVVCRLMNGVLVIRVVVWSFPVVISFVVGEQVISVMIWHTVVTNNIISVVG